MVDLASLFAQTEQQYGLPAGYLGRTAQIESSMNPSARNSNSSAGGLFQFIDSTANQYGLANRFDPIAATDAAARLARDNMGVLSGSLGRAPTAGELYLAHQQGAGGASALLSNPSAPAASVVGSAAAGLNRGAGLSAGDFAAQWLGKFGEGAPAMAGASPMMSGAPAMGAPNGMLLGDIAAQYLAGQRQKMEMRRAEQEAEDARRAALLGGGLYG